MIDKSALMGEAEALGVAVSREQACLFDRYAQLLVEWNERMNLTAITLPAEIVTKHFADSLSLLRAASPEKGARVIDVGTGAGFPGVPLKIMRPDLSLTLMDGLNKRVAFLENLSRELGQEDNLCVHYRAEEAGRLPEYRERYDLAAARAVAHLRELCEYCLPFLKVGGLFVAMKGGETGQETEEAAAAIRLLGGELGEARKLTLADGSARTLIMIKKISQCPTQYPRPHAKMAKKPLK